MNQNKSAYKLLSELAAALDGAFISTWQSTAAWQEQLDAALIYLEEQHGVEVVSDEYILTVDDYKEVIEDNKRLTKELGRLLLGDAAPEQPSLCELVSFAKNDGIEELCIPQGWKFYAADFSRHYETGIGSAVLILSSHRQTAWHRLPEEEREKTKLHVSGHGATIRLAIEDAVRKTS